MKDFNGQITYKDRTYKLCFNLNVMEKVQEEYGTLNEWATLTDGKNGEPNAKAIIFGFTEMLNEGIDIDNDENGTDIKHFTKTQVGRMITEIGIREATEQLNETVINSTASEEKNA